MTLQTINLSYLTRSPLNVRKRGAKDCADLVTSIRAIGLLQPLLVRPITDSADSDCFEVVAGQRRLNALRHLAEDNECKRDVSTVPCLILSHDDDATALEASLAKNIERLPMDEVDQYRAFTKLISEGRSVDEIAATFGLTERLVSQRLALGRLHSPILTAYRKGGIHARDIRILTMASPAQQEAWWALVKDEDAYVPTGQRLKDWLFGGSHIPTANALFDIKATDLAIIFDLFEDATYFADSAAFWTQQNAAIAELTEAYRAKGWQEVNAGEIGSYFARWDHRNCKISDSGAVFLEISHKGEVTCHEGFITENDARKRDQAADATPPAPKPELTKAAQNYVDLHRHAAVRADLLNHQSIALRLIAAHMIAGSSLWRVENEPQTAANTRNLTRENPNHWY